ncbi:pyroglutamyl-peptidase 1-like isoform X2 [Stegodyphus dumicola]|uniref:pyroglutamyl-peptidase 1-like isoform X2 n=1 Tax=Stegodyphus dumicola TaxID=202533 RepID=UPI0015B0D97C|nr:pyroglutamyl-peptidase 1-like isoform X2 [Stegodyphus dumicola]
MVWCLKLYLFCGKSIIQSYICLHLKFSRIVDLFANLENKLHNNELVVHCGMSDQANCLTIEKLAHRNDYYGCDITGQVPSGYTCCCDGPDVLYTSIDVEKVLEDVYGSGACVKAQASKDAGLYLCEFIFYTSLKINQNTAFVHIPPIGQPYSAREMAETLAIIIHSMLKQVQSSS